VAAREDWEGVLYPVEIEGTTSHWKVVWEGAVLLHRIFFLTF